MSVIRPRIERHRILTFLAVAYSFTWVVQAVLLASGMEASWTASILIGFGGFGPPIGAAVVLWATDGSLRQWLAQMIDWRVAPRWWLLAIGLPGVVLLSGSVLFVILGGPVDLTSFESPAIYLFAMAWGTIWGGGQEELGWRGFMLPILQERYSALVSSLLIGLAWAGWHLPLFVNATTVHGGWSTSQQAIWMVTITAGSILWTWMYNSTGGSVLVVAVFHAGINAMGIYHPADMAVLAPDGIPDPWLTLLAELTGAVPLVALAVGLVLLYGPAKLSSANPPLANRIGYHTNTS